MTRKIDTMHEMFGKTHGHKCKECSNLKEHPYRKSIYKCRVYGMTSSEASDWRLKYDACGMFNKEWDGNPIIKLYRGRPNRGQAAEPLIDGQISFEKGETE